MSPEALTIVVLAAVLLIAFILSEQPIWLGLACAGGVGLVLLEGSDVAVSAVGSAPFSATSKYALVVIPMFILMGVFASRAGVAADLFALAERATRRWPGGLGVATILACGGFSAVTGSSVATVATVGRIAIRQLTEKGYRPNAAAAIVAAGGTLGVLIPPSVILVVYASLVGESVGRLLLAGVVPGVVTMIAYAVTVVLLSVRGTYRYDDADRALSEVVAPADRGARAPAGEAGDPPGGRSGDGGTGHQGSLAWRHIAGAGYVAALFCIVIGGMYSGFFTATESGAVAAGVALLIMVARVRRSGFAGVLRALKESTVEATALTSMIFALLAGGAIFSYFLIKSGVPNQLTRDIVAADLPPVAIVIVALAIMIVLGFFLDSYSIMVITIPLMWPVMSGLGVDGIWFGILTVKAIEIGLLTPPFGINVFVVSSVSPLVTVDKVFRAVLPLVAAEFFVIALFLMFPGIVTWLPDLVYGVSP